MLLGLIAAALQLAPPAPPAAPAPPQPTIVPLPPAPPAPPLPPPAIRNRPPATFQVRVSLGAERLVEERLRVGFPATASINRTRQEALGGDCPGASASLNSQLNLSLRPDFSGANLAADRDRYRVNVLTNRPVQQGCDSGSRGITLDQQFTLAPGQSVTFTGDGGLRVEIRRE